MYVRILMASIACVLLLIQNANAGQAVVRVKCARDNAQLFVNGAPKGKCPTDFFKDLFLTPGKYEFLAKQELKDGSTYSSEETLSVYADVVERLIFKVDILTYSEEYYWQKCSNKQEKSCVDYLEKYPKGKYTQKVKKIIANFPKPGALYTEPTTGMEFVYIPGGCYQMGDTFGDGYSTEQPVHKVCVNGFYIGKFEVTIAQYRKYIIASGNEGGVDWSANNCPLKKENGYPLSNNKFGQNERQPMVEVSWNGATDMAKWISGRSGKAFRLPTEAEWEYAGREGGKNIRFGTGKNSVGADEANFDASAKYKKSYSRSGQYREKTVRVGSFSANAFGLYDMAGNVYEWCSDWYGEKYYGSSAMDNPQGPSSGSGRVVRGGSWDSYPGSVRAAYRYRNTPGYTISILGFRLVLSPGQQ